jgi:hypothetical protein
VVGMTTDALNDCQLPHCHIEEDDDDDDDDSGYYLNLPLL